MIKQLVGIAIGLSFVGTVLAESIERQKVSPGKVVMLNVSEQMVNELIVPFSSPTILTFLGEDTQASIQNDGRSIYVSTGNEDFVQLIIKNADAPDHPGISLMLMPSEIPAQHIEFEIEDMGYGLAGASKEASALNSSDYVDLLRELLRQGARDQIPDGYTKDANWHGSRIQVGELVGEPAKRYLGNALALEFFVVKNTGPVAIELAEPNFVHNGVRAIAFVDKHILSPGGATRMIWVRDRESGGE